MRVPIFLAFVASSHRAAAAQAQSDAAPAPLPILPPPPPSLQQPLQPAPAPRGEPAELELTLRHIFHHGIHKYPSLHRRLDITGSDDVSTLEDGDLIRGVAKLKAKPRRQRIQRLADRRHSSIDALLEAGRESGSALTLGASGWTDDEIWGPNITDKETVIAMARIASNAYVTERSDSDWQEVGGGFNYTEDFGWENDGLRGHIFADTQNETVVIGIKGTTPAVFDGADTTTNDKINDNLFFSCCCGQGGQFTWHQVCDCQTSAYTCNSTCVTQALRKKNRYYYAAQEIYRNVSQIYPNADIWLAGHSLGGATSSLLGLTYGLPTVTFEAPGDALPAVRLGLPTPPGYSAGYDSQRAGPNTGGYHFGHTADPIFMGTCNTITSVCTIAGYAMQSRCHTGLTCIYDTVGDLGWRTSSTTHKIVSVIKDVLMKYDDVAKCEPMANCTDCFNWSYFESNHSDTTTSMSTSTSTTVTRTSTCKTPGWWGCLDETTTTSSVSTRSDFSTTITTTSTTTTQTDWTTTTSTSTCQTPGWFGCNDKTTTTSTPTSAQTSPTPAFPLPTSTYTTESSSSSISTTETSTCNDPGWFGCNDPVSTSTEILTTTVSATSTIVTTTNAAQTSSSQIPTPTGDPSGSSSCETPGWFGACRDPTSALPPSVTGTQTATAPGPAPTEGGGDSAGDRQCLRRNWLGFCKEWGIGRQTCLRRSWLGFCQEWGIVGESWNYDL